MEFNFTQASTSSTWVINHNLNSTSVVIDVFVYVGADLLKILPMSVVETTDNTVTVTFSTPYAGIARVLG